MTQEIFAMEKMMYFFTNHGPAEEVVRNIWTGIEADHFMDKLKACDYSFAEFFYELSADNQEKFCQYILDNYHGIDSRKPVEWTATVSLDGYIFDTAYFKKRGITEEPSLGVLLETIWHDESLEEFLMAPEQEGARMRFVYRRGTWCAMGEMKFNTAMFHYYFDKDRIKDVSELINACEGRVYIKDTTEWQDLPPQLRANH